MHTALHLASLVATLFQAPQAPQPSAAPATAAQTSRKSMEEILPADALFTLRARDISDVREFLLGKGPMFEEPVLRKALDAMEVTPDKLSGEFEKEVGMPLREILDVLAGPAGISVFAPEVPTDEPTMLLALAVKPGDATRAVWKKLQERIRALHKERNVRERDEEFEGAEIWTRNENAHAGKAGREPGADEPEPEEVMYTLHRDVFLTGNSRDALQHAILALNGKTTPTLSGREDFKAAMTRFGKVSSWMAYFSFDELWRMLDENENAKMAGPVLRALGVRSLHSVTFGSAMTADAYEARVFVHAPGARSGILKVLSSGKKPLDMGRFASADSMNAGALGLDPAEILAEAERLQAMFGGGEELDLTVGETDMRKDLLELLVPPFYMVSALGPAEEKPRRQDLLMYMACREPKRVEQSMKTLFAAGNPAAPGGVKESEFLGTVIRTLDLQTFGSGFSGAQKPALSFAVADGFVLVSLTGPVAIQNALSTIGKDVKPITGTPEYRRAMAGLPEGKLTVSFSKLTAALEAAGENFSSEIPLFDQMLGASSGQLLKHVAEVLAAAGKRVEAMGYTAGWDDAGMQVSARITQPAQRENARENAKAEKKDGK